MNDSKRCLVILADGARADVMENLCKTGKLPAIGESLVASGSLKHGVSAFPSTTGPAYLPYLTGCYPGTCNVPGIRWFDKECFAKKKFSLKRFRSYVGPESYFMNGDVDPSRKTLFDLIPNSVSLFSTINRGVGFGGNQSKFSRIWYWYYSHLTDHWGLIDEAAEAKTLHALKGDPEFLFVVFPGIDEFSHLASPFHPRAIQAYQRLDQAVGRIVGQLKQEGKWDETALFIVSDHGLSETKRHFALNQYLEKQGLSTFFYPKILKWRFEAASMVSGNGMSNVYFKNREGWGKRTSWDELASRSDRIIEKLLENPEVDIIAGQNEDGSVVVKSQRGEANISVGAGSSRPGAGTAPLQYRVIGSDPFAYPKLPEFLTDRQSLALSDKTDYPDAPAQLLQIFRSQRAGDLVISAAKGSDLRLRHEHPEHKSSHGSLHWEHMKVPIVTNVKLSEGPMRSVDVFPTILSLLGRPIPQGMDGSVQSSHKII